LEYIGECFNNGLDIKFLTPVAANAASLISKLSIDENEALIDQLLKNPSIEEMKTFVSDEKNFLKYKNRLQHSKYWKYWEFANSEFISQEIIRNQNFENFAIWQYITKNQKFKEVVDELHKTDQSINIIKIIKILEAQNYTPQTDNIKDFILSRNSDLSDTYPKLPITNTGKVMPQTDAFTNLLVRRGFNDVLTRTGFSPTISSKMNTNYRKEALNVLTVNFSTVTQSISPIVIINFVVNCLLSMQSATINGITNFELLLGSVLDLAKNKLKITDFNILVKMLNKNLDKLKSPNSAKLKQAIKNYATDDLTTDSSTGLPDSFLKKITEIRSV
jgi:hypothetical protein